MIGAEQSVSYLRIKKPHGILEIAFEGGDLYEDTLIKIAVFCCSCNSPVYVDPTGLGYQTIPFTKHAIELHNKIKEIIGDNQKAIKSDVPITISIPDSVFVKK